MSTALLDFKKVAPAILAGALLFEAYETHRVGIEARKPRLVAHLAVSVEARRVPPKLLVCLFAHTLPMHVRVPTAVALGRSDSANQVTGAQLLTDSRRIGAEQVEMSIDKVHALIEQAHDDTGAPAVLLGSIRVDIQNLARPGRADTSAYRQVKVIAEVDIFIILGHVAAAPYVGAVFEPAAPRVVEPELFVRRFDYLFLAYVRFESRAHLWLRIPDHTRQVFERACVDINVAAFFIGEIKKLHARLLCLYVCNVPPATYKKLRKKSSGYSSPRIGTISLSAYVLAGITHSTLPVILKLSLRMIGLYLGSLLSG